MGDSEKQCPDCAEFVKSEARICRFCNYEFSKSPLVETKNPPSIQETESSSTENGFTENPNVSAKPLLIGGLILAAFFLYASLAGGQDSGSTFAEDTATDIGAEADAIMAEMEAAAAGALGEDSTSETIGNWQYIVSQDEARGADIKTASITSENQVFLSPPYDGGTRARLVIRQHPSYGLDIFVEARPSQIVCRSYDGCSGLINIDGNPETLSLNTSADYNSEIVFFRFPRPLLSRIQGSERVIIELPFYSNGNRQFTFNTEGLEWPITENSS
ncbi:MAG: zinc ribbon domain-containing protein [Parasphingopyxis sp.]|uniref:zinc ribbon domain-containing protein n=1 Tax=Parasphingopyxis sp. TaxID=1920299 RepID=UPI003FA06BC0